MSCFGISIGTSVEKVSLSPAISTTRKSCYAVSSRPRIKVTIRPSTLTADTIPRTLGTPNFSFKIGRRKTPNVAPSFATPAANPPAVPRNGVGNKIGARVKVVELGPAFISRLNKMNPTNTSGMCKLEFVRPTAATNTNIPTAIPVKPIACIRMRPNRGTHPDAKQETEQQKQVDNGATLCDSKVVCGQSTRSSGNFDRSENCRGKQSNAVRSNIHQKPGDSYQRRARPITARKQDRQPTFYLRNRRCELLVITGKLQYFLSLLGNDPNESLRRLCKFTARHQPVRTFWCRQA